MRPRLPPLHPQKAGNTDGVKVCYLFHLMLYQFHEYTEVRQIFNILTLRKTLLGGTCFGPQLKNLFTFIKTRFHTNNDGNQALQQLN